MKEYVAIKVVRANLRKDSSSPILARNFAHAEIEWIPAKGEKFLLSKTRSIRNDSPIWDFTCQSSQFNDEGEQIEVSVYRNMFKSISLRSLRSSARSLSSGGSTKSLNASSVDVPFGSAIIKISELLSKSKNKPYEVILLDSNRLRAGEIYFCASLIHVNEDSTLGSSLVGMQVAKFAFENPVKRMGVSGGTAPFFHLKLLNPLENQSPTHYLGKDLAHADDEYEFYEIVSRLKEQKKDTGFGKIFDFMFEYCGVYEAIEDDENADKMNLLVMRNLHDGKKRLRLLDFKIGYKTASAGWQGKSWIAAMRQRALLDNTTNSTIEGFRLEGFDGMPKTLVSRDPTLDGHVLDRVMDKSKSKKKTIRHSLQSLTGIEIMPFFLDLSEFQEEYENDKEKYYSPEETSEILLRTTICKLTKLALECQKVMVPQKWIGSSVALGFDCGELPLRSKGEESIGENIIVNIFDWGRSTLTLANDQNEMTSEQKSDFAKFWNYYTSGIRHLAWDAAHYYYHRFGNTKTWRDFTVTIKDYDGITAHDMVGTVALPVEEMELKKFQITYKKKKNRGTLTASIKWKSYPSESCFEGSWRILIACANDIPNLDQGSLSDAYCIITARSEDGKKFDQYSSVIENDLNPVWNETFEVPIMKSDSRLCEILTEEKLAISETELPDIFSDRKMTRSRVKISRTIENSNEECLESWKKLLHRT